MIMSSRGATVPGFVPPLVVLLLVAPPLVVPPWGAVWAAAETAANIETDKMAKYGFIHSLPKRRGAGRKSRKAGSTLTDNAPNSDCELSP